MAGHAGNMMHCHFGLEYGWLTSRWSRPGAQPGKMVDPLLLMRDDGSCSISRAAQLEAVSLPSL
jgi:hypothetical protein